MFEFLVGLFLGWLTGLYFRPQVEVVVNWILDWTVGRWGGGGRGPDEPKE